VGVALTFAWDFSVYDIELRDEIPNGQRPARFREPFFTIPRFQNIKRSRHSA